MLNDDEKRSLRLVKMYGQFRGPNWRDYQRYLGTAHLSVNWNCWRDLSGFIGIDNTYNRFQFVNNERVLRALQWLQNNNSFYQFENFNADELVALTHLNDI